MKKTTFVALLLLSTQCFAENLIDSLKGIEQRWATIYYDTAKPQQAQAYEKLLETTLRLSKQHPNQADLIYWQAVILSTHAEHLNPVSALAAVQDASDLLERAIAINPKAMNGSAYVTLGTLYYKVPKWPISFGDDGKAKALLETALKINPHGVDANYFYGDFLLSNNKAKEAEGFLNQAIAVLPTADMTYTDARLKEEARAALKKVKEQDGDFSESTVSLSSPTVIK
jgi:tetratricopeptide (TPR) repeat protein